MFAKLMFLICNFHYILNIIQICHRVCKNYLLYKEDIYEDLINWKCFIPKLKNIICCSRLQAVNSAWFLIEFGFGGDLMCRPYDFTYEFNMIVYFWNYAFFSGMISNQIQKEKKLKLHTCLQHFIRFTLVHFYINIIRNIFCRPNDFNPYIYGLFSVIE